MNEETKKVRIVKLKTGEIKEIPIPTSTGGVKMKTTLFFPAVDSHYEDDPDKAWVPMSSEWKLEDTIQHIFPRHKSKRYYDMALELIQFIFQTDPINGVDSSQIEEWRKAKKYAIGTLHSIIIPKLIDFGILKRRFLNPSGEKAKQGKRIVLYPTTLFSTHLHRLAETYEKILDRAKQDYEVKKKQQLNIVSV